MATKERGEEKRSPPPPPTDTLEAQKGLRKQLSDDKSFTEQKEKEKSRFGGSNEIGSAVSSTQHAIWGERKKGGESKEHVWKMARVGL